MITQEPTTHIIESDGNKTQLTIHEIYRNGGDTDKGNGFEPCVAGYANISIGIVQCKVMIMSININGRPELLVNPPRCGKKKLSPVAFTLNPEAHEQLATIVVERFRDLLVKPSTKVSSVSTDAQQDTWRKRFAQWQGEAANSSHI